jgi:hypothetical protein
LHRGRRAFTIGSMKAPRTTTSTCAVLIVALAALSLLACGRAGGPAAGATESAEPADEMLREAPAPALSKAEDEAGATGAGENTGAVLEAAVIPQEPGERRRIYSGFCRLMVDEVEEAKADLTRFAEQNGGYVESASQNTIVLRVPAAGFRELFEAVLDKGELLYQSIETYDVSDTLRDQQARLRTAERARGRLYTLLERTEDVEERLAILREIKRLSEEIEGIRLRLQSLESQISFSRITVELVARLPIEQMHREEIPFPWIASLQPLAGSLPRMRGRVSLPLGEEFAVLESRPFRAENSDGVRVRIGSIGNQPDGDEEFWQRALVHHLEPYYRSAEALQAGTTRGVLFTSKDRNPYAYLVAVHVEGRTLYVLEVFFPNLETRERHLAGIRRAIETMEVRSWLW